MNIISIIYDHVIYRWSSKLQKLLFSDIDTSKMLWSVVQSLKRVPSISYLQKIFSFTYLPILVGELLIKIYIPVKIFLKSLSSFTRNKHTYENTYFFSLWTKLFFVLKNVFIYNKHFIYNLLYKCLSKFQLSIFINLQW